MAWRYHCLPICYKIQRIPGILAGTHCMNMAASQVSIPTAALGFQGAVNVLFGLYGLLRPSATVATLAEQFDSTVTRPVAYTSRYSNPSSVLTSWILMLLQSTTPRPGHLHPPLCDTIEPPPQSPNSKDVLAPGDWFSLLDRVGQTAYLGYVGCCLCGDQCCCDFVRKRWCLLRRKHARMVSQAQFRLVM